MVVLLTVPLDGLRASGVLCQLLLFNDNSALLGGVMRILFVRFEPLTV